jgi:adenine deaminase
MKIQIREGSAAKNFEALAGLLHDHWGNMMFCSDDKHPDSLEEGHINLLVKRALAKGIDLYKVLTAACINPIQHYHLDVGMLRAGDPADFIVIDNPTAMHVRQTYVGGILVAEDGSSKIERIKSKVINHFSVHEKTQHAFAVPSRGSRIRIIEALDGQLITNEIIDIPRIHNGLIVADTSRDILKITVVNRYADKPPAVAFIKGFGLKHGAIASSVGHDSHNIIAVGVDDESICHVVNLLIRSHGGVAALSPGDEMEIPLPVAGIMSPEDGYKVSKMYKAIDHMAKEMGSTLGSPFMTLSFMALLVIPSLKLSDKGLFDGSQFKFVDTNIQ